LSHWLYDKKTLYSFAKHYRTGELVPDAMFEELLVERSRRSAATLLQRINENQLELELHSTFDPAGSTSILDLEKAMHDRYASHTGKTFKKGDLSTFALIFGTDPGEPEFRYRYLWAEVMSLDAYAAFEEAGKDNEVEMMRLGQDFRTLFLASGGGLSYSEAFKRFRGRDPSTDAFMSWHGFD
jgi:oligopeptidase A